MKIRTDFVTNSSSSSFVTITVTLHNGSTLEQEYPMEDIGFQDSLYTLEEKEILDLLSGHESVGDLLAKLNDFYDEMLLDEDEDSLDDIAFSNIAEITVIDKWDCDGDDAGVMIAEYTAESGTWSIQSLTADEEDEENEDDEDWDDED